MCAGVEERLILVRERDVYYDGGGDGKKAGAEGGAQEPGVFGCEVLEYEGGVDAGYGLELHSSPVNLILAIV